MKDEIDALIAQQCELDAIMADLPAGPWDTMTPADPWTIRDTISHLAFFDEKQTEAITDPEKFYAEINQRLTGGTEDYMRIATNRGQQLSTDGVLDWWRAARAVEIAAFRSLEPEQRLAWYGPPIKARSAVIARLMETWAHGQDVNDALELAPVPTARLFYIAELGVKTFSWSFINRGLDVPVDRVRVTLDGPQGLTRVWNEQSSDSITGRVEQFCLVVAQRRHYLDTDLVIRGDTARRWMEIAQVFAGPPGPGRPRSQA